MHSFHPSRGRILFEAVCALGIAASCAVAWTETGASALLAAAAIAALYGLWHLTDMWQPGLALATPASDAPAGSQPDLLDYLASVEPTPVPVAEPEPVVEAGPQPLAVRQEPKKRRSRKKAPVTEAPEPSAPKREAPELTVNVGEPAENAEDHHAPIVPLFEAQPIVRQQRAVFGRKAG